MTIVVDPRAQAEIDDAVAYYGSRRNGLGTEFAEAVSRAYDLIEANPRAWAGIDGAIRKHVLSRFPYSIYYGISETTIRIVAVAHQSRRPRYWRDRLR